MTPQVGFLGNRGTRDGLSRTERGEISGETSEETAFDSRLEERFYSPFSNVLVLQINIFVNKHIPSSVVDSDMEGACTECVKWKS